MVICRSFGELAGSIARRGRAAGKNAFAANRRSDFTGSAWLFAALRTASLYALDKFMCNVLGLVGARDRHESARYEASSQEAST